MFTLEFINIDLKERSYPIYFTNNEFEHIGDTIKKHIKGSRVFIITDSNVYPLYFDIVYKSLKNSGLNVSHYVIPAGETSKTMEMAEILLNNVYESGLLRDSAIIALGGGVVGDIAGFVAATYMRGVDFVQIPTTLLAQVDSSVGGKVAVNLKNGKNIVGAFHQPRLVYIDTIVLKNLNKREILGGLAEIIKYGVIWDWSLFEYLEKNILDILSLDIDKLKSIIKKSCEIKGKIVSLDEKEENLRAILNYGHTIGHAIEALTGYEKYIHGEAVAIGMVYAAMIALNLGYINNLHFERIKSLIDKTGLPTRYYNLSKEDIIELIKHDKKNREEKIKFVLPIGYGKADVFDISFKDISEVLEK